MFGTRRKRDGKLERLAAVEPFRRFDVEELRLVGTTADITWCAAGTSLIEYGRLGSECFVVIDGEVSVTVDDHEVARLGKGEVFGELSLLDGTPRSASVTAVTDVELAVFDRRSFDRALHAIPDLDTTVRTTASRRRLAMN